MWWQTYLNVVPYFLYYLFTFYNSSSARIESILCTYFHIKLLIFFESVPFTCITMCTEQKLSFRIIATSPRYTSFVNFTFWCLFFFRGGLTRPVVQPKTNRCRNTSETETYTSSKTYRGDNVLEIFATSYKTKLQINITCIRMCFL